MFSNESHFVKEYEKTGNVDIFRHASVPSHTKGSEESICSSVLSWNSAKNDRILKEKTSLEEL